MAVLPGRLGHRRQPESVTSPCADCWSCCAHRQTKERLLAAVCTSSTSHCWLCAVVPLVSLQGGAGAILGAARTLAQLQPAGVQVGTGSCGDRAQSSRASSSQPIPALSSATLCSFPELEPTLCHTHTPLQVPSAPTSSASLLSPSCPTPICHPCMLPLTHTPVATPHYPLPPPRGACGRQSSPHHAPLPKPHHLTSPHPCPTPLHPPLHQPGRSTSSQPRVRTWSVAAPPSPATSTQQLQARQWRSTTQTQRADSHWQMHCGTRRHTRARRYVGARQGHV